MISPRTSRFGSSVLALAIAFGAFWFLTGCSPSETTPTKVLGERIERTTSTTEYVSPTTTTVYIPPTTTTVYVPPTPTAANKYVVLAALRDAIPAFDIPGTDDMVWRLLSATCEMIDENNGDFEEVGYGVVAASIGTFDLDLGDAGAILGAAVAGVCPRWLDAAQAYVNS